MPPSALAVLGFGLSLELGLYRLGVAPRPWEPFLHAGTLGVLELHATYAGLGSVGFLLAAVAGTVGGRRRWQSMPWMVLLFGLLACLLAAGSVLLVIIEPIPFDTWSSRSLLTALLAVLMLGPAMAEVLASLQFLKRVRSRGGSAWRALWGTPEGGLSSLQATAAGN